MKAIEVEQLTKCFGTFTAVDHISLGVESDEIFDLLGANGVGKTTAMCILCGLSVPASGEARIAGFNVYRESEFIKWNIGYMSQKFSLYGDLKVWENIRFFGGTYGSSKRQLSQKTDELLNTFGLGKERNTLVDSLPLGRKQKLSFSVATIHDPKIVFSGEPTGGIDPITRCQSWELIYEAAARGTTILVTTHYMDEAEYCNRVSIMADGRIEVLDGPSALKRDFKIMNMNRVFHALARKVTRGEQTMKQFMSLVRKEFYHIFRDARTTMVLLLMPVILIILFGYAITTEIRQVSIIIFDQSRDELTLKMTDRLNTSEYFELYTTVDSYEDAEALFRQGKVHVIVVFPSQYASTADAQVQALADATDPNEATQLIAHCSTIIVEQLKDESAVESKAVTLVTTLPYNPQMRGAYNFVPGITGSILILICAMMTPTGIVKEKEMGTMEVLLISSLESIYIILAKAISCLLLSMVNIIMILLLSYFLLDVSIKGSLLLLVSAPTLYAIVSFCLGLLISTVADIQQTAMLISGIALTLSIMLLSGMMFPIENMLDILRWFSHIVPTRWYIIAMKNVTIKGLPAVSILKEIGILPFMAVMLVLLSVKRLKI